MEIHFLRCYLGKTDQSLLDDVDLLMSKKLPKGWTDKLEKVSVMSSEAVEQEVGIRGAKNKVSAWEAKKPPIVTDPAGGARVMTKDFFCRDTLRDLREKTPGLPIPLIPYLAPNPTNIPAPVKPPQKPKPSIPPKRVPSKQPVSKPPDLEMVTETINRAFQPPSPPINPSSGKKLELATKLHLPLVHQHLFLFPLSLMDG